ncbi:MAG: hypothetical protein HZC28_09785 [Spirochaetes bacterium]|nr:hypothetical protein [Spirochaetota bacterium]
MRRLILAYIFLVHALFARNIAIVTPFPFGLAPEDKYHTLAFADLVSKDLLLYTAMNENPVNETNTSYENIKRNVKKLSDKYNADVLIAATISPFKEDFVLRYFIYERSNPHQWKERTRSARKERFYRLVTDFIDDFYPTVKIKRDGPPLIALNEEAYTPLMGYYQELYDIGEKYRPTSRTYQYRRSDCYTKFYQFYQDNLWFNLDYCPIVLENGPPAVADAVTASITKTLGESHHYVSYLSAVRFYHRYRVKVSQEDLGESMKHISRAIELRPLSYNYHFWLSKLFFLQEDFANAELTLEKVIDINPTHIPSYKGLISILKGKGTTEHNETIIRYATRVIEAESENTEMYNLVAGIYEGQTSWSNAYYWYDAYYRTLDMQIRNIGSTGITNVRQYANLQYQSKYVAKKVAYAYRMAIETRAIVPARK